MDAQARQHFRDASFEPEFFEIASPLIPERGVFFDVGANFGWCSFGLFGATPEQRIRYFLFEANASVLKCVRQSQALNSGGDFQIVSGCVLDKPGFSALEASADDTGSGYYSGPDPTGVPNIVLDQFIAEHKISAVDLLKMDIEGCEPFALDGARRSLSSGIVKAVYMEVSAKNLGRQGRQPNDCISALRETGFSAFWCKPRDFEMFSELRSSSVTVRSARGSFLVAPMNSFPQNHQTDIRALHNDTPLLRKLMNCYRSIPASGPEAREVRI
jgi:FkbM family methyltransferase